MATCTIPHSQNTRSAVPTMKLRLRSDFTLPYGSWRLLSSLSCALLIACAEPSIITQATQQGLTPEIARGAPFLHLLIHQAGEGHTLHVYIEGDGSPWQTPTRIARNPDPINRLMFSLMLTDHTPSVYLGRPCYFALQDTHCNAQWWTDKRYSEAVVTSMQAALATYAKHYKKIILIGHSGGGTLAMLLAAQQAKVVAVITLAPNLDTDRWADHHRYTRLAGSLNPALQPPLAAHISQHHYLGNKDAVITEEMLLPMINKQHNATFYSLDGIDHSCCWQSHWSDILAYIDTIQ